MRRTLCRLGIILAASLPAVSSSAAVSSATPRYAVIIVLDGTKPSYLKLVPMPNLQALESRGTMYTRAFVGQEVAETPPSHATIGTGLFPSHHGIQAFEWKDPRTDTKFRPTNYLSVLHGDLEQIMQQNHVSSIASVLKGSDPSARIVSVSAHKCYASDAMGTAAADYILCAGIVNGHWQAEAIRNHSPPPGAVGNPKWDVKVPNPDSGFAAAVEQWHLGTENDWSVRLALWAFHRIHYPRVLMINLPETDVMGHYSHNTKAIAVLMAGFDQLLGKLVAAYRHAGILDSTDFIVTSDHGMTRTHAIVPYHLLEQAVTEAGTIPVSIEADTAAAIGIQDVRRAPQVALNLARLGGTLIDATYYKVRSQGRWAYRQAAAGAWLTPSETSADLTLVDTMASESSADVFAVYAPHVTTRIVQAHGYTWSAGHLGPQWDEQHIPLILAGPGVRAGLTSTYPARLVDIAPTVERLLGLPVPVVDGHVLQDALTDPSSEGLAQQAAIQSQLDPVIAALQLRSQQRPR